MTKSGFLAFWLSGLALAAGSPVTAQSDPHLSLGEFRLGMSIEEVAAVGVSTTSNTLATKVPSLELTTENRFGCSSGAHEIGSIYIDSFEENEGVVVCRHLYGFVSSYSKTVSSWTPDSIEFGSITLQPTFKFLNDKLYEIELAPNMNWRQQYLDALQLKYGTATSHSTGTASNAYGASWPTDSYVWTKGSEELRFKAPSGDRDTMYVVYVDTPVSNALDQRVRQAKAKGAGI